MTMPGNDEENPPIAGTRHHQRRIAGQKAAVEDQMDTLAGDQQRFCLWVIHTTNGVGEYARGIDHDARRNR